MTRGETFKNLREERGMTQMQLADKSGIPQPTISIMENDKHQLMFDTVIKMAEGLGIKPVELMSMLMGGNDHD